MERVKLWAGKNSPAQSYNIKADRFAGCLENRECFYLVMGGKMTEYCYQKLMEESDNACKQAIASYQKKDWESFEFWKKLSVNLKERALNLPWK